MPKTEMPTSESNAGDLTLHNENYSHIDLQFIETQMQFMVSPVMFHPLPKGLSGPQELLK